MTCKIKNFIISYFGSGWLFFIPYLMLYLAFWISNSPVSILLKLFYILHALNAVGLGYFIYLKYRHINLRDLFFWAALFSLFFNVGAYLEFPSDPWSHLFRIFQWEHINQIHEANSKYKFAYFFGFSILDQLDPINHKFGLNAYHTLWALLTTIQFYKLASTTFNSKPWAKLATACIILMLGNSSFNFFSYYGISSTMLSMIAFLAALNTLVLWQNKKLNYNVFLLSFTLTLGIFNHPQSLLLLLSCGTGVLFHFIIAKHGWLSFFKGIGIGSLTTSILFYLIIQLPICDDFNKLLSPYKLSGEWFYIWGGFKLFSFNPEINNAPGRFMQILGWYGIFNCFASIYLIKKNHIIGWISLSPILFLLYPPFAQTLAFILLEYKVLIVFQRILLGIPLSFSIILIFKNVTELKFLKVSKTLIIPFIFIFHLLISINPNPQYFGRFFNIFERPNSDSGFDKVFETSSLIKQRQIHFHKIKILSDTATQTLINSQLGLSETNRLNAESLSSKIADSGGILKIHTDSNITHILALSKQPYLNPSGSILGKSSGHWGNQHLAKCLKYDPNLQSELDKLTKLGWIKKPVKPWYYLYERKPL
jgi:hypothetical protein